MAPVWRLPMGMRQRVEILKALYRDAEILILDEPTSVLAPGEIERFLAGLRRLRDGGHTILFITHKLEEVMAVADRVTVMRNGTVTAEDETAATDRRRLARLMVGRDVMFEIEERQGEPGAVVLEAEGLVAENDRGLRALDDLSLDPARRRDPGRRRRRRQRPERARRGDRRAAAAAGRPHPGPRAGHLGPRRARAPDRGRDRLRAGGPAGHRAGAGLRRAREPHPARLRPPAGRPPRDPQLRPDQPPRRRAGPQGTTSACAACASRCACSRAATSRS